MCQRVCVDLVTWNGPVVCQRKSFCFGRAHPLAGPTCLVNLTSLPHSSICLIFSQRHAAFSPTHIEWEW